MNNKRAGIFTSGLIFLFGVIVGMALLIVTSVIVVTTNSELITNVVSGFIPRQEIINLCNEGLGVAQIQNDLLTQCGEELGSCQKKLYACTHWEYNSFDIDNTSNCTGGYC